jgi:hypothetical protein
MSCTGSRRSIRARLPTSLAKGAEVRYGSLNDLQFDLQPILTGSRCSGAEEVLLDAQQPASRESLAAVQSLIGVTFPLDPSYRDAHRLLGSVRCRVTGSIRPPAATAIRTASARRPKFSMGKSRRSSGSVDRSPRDALHPSGAAPVQHQESITEPALARARVLRAPGLGSNARAEPVPQRTWSGGVLPISGIITLATYGAVHGGGKLRTRLMPAFMTVNLHGSSHQDQTL